MRRLIGRICPSACSPRSAVPGAGDLLLGVDGGNTKTIAVVARSDGTVLGTGSAGCSDVHNAVSPEAALGEGQIETKTEAVTARTAPALRREPSRAA